MHAEAGWHRIDVRRLGYQGFSAEVKLNAGERTELRVILLPESGERR